LPASQSLRLYLPKLFVIGVCAIPQAPLPLRKFAYAYRLLLPLRFGFPSCALALLPLALGTGMKGRTTIRPSASPFSRNLFFPSRSASRSHNTGLIRTFGEVPLSDVRPRNFGSARQGFWSFRAGGLLPSSFRRLLPGAPSPLYPSRETFRRALTLLA